MTVEHALLMLEGNTDSGFGHPFSTSDLLITFEVSKAFLEKNENSFAFLIFFVCREFEGASIDIFRMFVYAFLEKFDLSQV